MSEGSGVSGLTAQRFGGGEGGRNIIFRKRPSINKNNVNKYYNDIINFNVPQFITTAADFIKDAVDNLEYAGILVPLSGGLDSAVVAAISKETGKKVELLTVVDKKYIRPQDITDVKAIAHRLGLKLNLLDASEAFDVPKNLYTDHTIMGIRSSLIYGEGEKNNSLIINCGNKSEELYDLCNPSGAVGTILPIGNMYKTQIYHIAEYLNLPRYIKIKPSHSGIVGEDNDEKGLGHSFKTLDVLSHLLLDRKWTPENVAKELNLSSTYVSDFKSKILKNSQKMSFPMLEFNPTSSFL
jgi:NAD+ synthase